MDGSQSWTWTTSIRVYSLLIVRNKEKKRECNATFWYHIVVRFIPGRTKHVNIFDNFYERLLNSSTTSVPPVNLLQRSPFEYECAKKLNRDIFANERGPTNSTMKNYTPTNRKNRTNSYSRIIKRLLSLYRPVKH